MIHVRTLGTLEVTVDGAEAPSELLWKKNIALLLYLARSPKRRCTREQLIGLLWPDKDDDAARQSVREAIRVVRQYVGEGLLTTTGDVVQLVDGAVELDTDQLEKLVRQRDWAHTTPLINGHFLQGFKVPDAAGFEDWLTVERSFWDGLSMDALLRHAEERLDAGDELGADEPLRRAREMDPLSQRALRAHLRRLAGAGDRAGALQLFDRFVKDARRDGDVTIEPETQAMVDRLRSGRAWHLPKEALSPERSVTWRRAPLLGRDHELETALRQWRRAGDGRLALLVIEAESGGGKTRFLEELATRAAVGGGIVIGTRAVAADVAHPASAILGLARGGLVHAPGVAGANPGALATLATHASEWAEQFPQKSTAASTGTLDAAIAEVLRVTTAEQPHLLVFDDAQWIDSTSYQMIEQLARDLARAPALIALATTPEPAPPKLAELRARIGRDVPGAVTSLGKLNHEAILQLVGWALPAYTGEAADRLARRIAADSGGLPRLAEARGYVFVARIVRDVVARDMVTEGERQRILVKKC